MSKTQFLSLSILKTVKGKANREAYTNSTQVLVIMTHQDISSGERGMELIGKYLVQTGGNWRTTGVGK
jgi:hypothetical protein